MKLSIIIVNYKSSKLVFNCLQSIFQFNTDDFEIIVVDNFSNDDIEQLLSVNFPNVHFIQMGYNAGFARANNAGINVSKGENILLLNSDTLIENDAINEVLTLFNKFDYVACGVQLLNEDRSAQIAGNYAMKGGLNYLLPLPFLGDIIKSMGTLFKVNKPNVPNADDLVEVDWINGAFLMVKKKIINQSGLLDEDFFLYAEEAEWCSRIKKQGKLCIFGQCKVIHLQGETANKAFSSIGKGYFNLSDKKGQQIMLSNFVRIRKEFGVGWFLFDLLFYFIDIPVFLIGYLLEKILFLSKSRYTFIQIVGFVKNVGVLFYHTPKIISNKPFFYKVL